MIIKLDAINITKLLQNWQHIHPTLLEEENWRNIGREDRVGKGKGGKGKINEGADKKRARKEEGKEKIKGKQRGRMCILRRKKNNQETF